MSRYELGVIPDELQRPLVDNAEGSSANTAYDYSERLPPNDPHLAFYARFLAAHHAALMPMFSLFYLDLPGHRNLWKEPAAPLLDPAKMFQPSDRGTGEAQLSAFPMGSPLADGRRSTILKMGRGRKKSNTPRGSGALIRPSSRLTRITSPLQARIRFGSMPGISMHTELEMLVRLGLSPREALAAATNNYALQFGWTELGQVAPGRRADILIIDGDPTQNVWNIRHISGLIEDGNLLDRDALLTLKK